MDSKWCSTCTDSRPITSFLKDPTDQSSRVLATCSACRVHKKRNRDASRELDASIPPENVPPGVRNGRIKVNSYCSCSISRCGAERPATDFVSRRKSAVRTHNCQDCRGQRGFRGK